jgi:hypothetical protein
MLLAGYLIGAESAPETAAGDFVIGDPDTQAGWAMSSTIGAVPWYYTLDRAGQLHQGGNVFELCRTAQLDWEWNFTAIKQIAAFGHTLGRHTLHPRIFRLDAHAQVGLANGQVQVEAIDPMSTWQWDCTPLDPTFTTLTNAFTACLEGAETPLLSLSAGFDSRLLFALCLHFGVAPRIACMGPATATDFKVASILAARTGTKVERVDLDQNAYLANGAAISWVTSGTKNAGDWHTYLYSQQLDAADKVHLVGSNGEFARSFYRDVLTRAPLFDRAGRSAVRSYFAVRAINRLRKYPSGVVAAGLGEIASVFGAFDQAHTRYPKSSLACLDAFYAIERVRHFIGAGLACYAAFCKPRSPFLDGAWMKSIAALARENKQADRYHRAAIRKFAADLDEVPYNTDPDGAANVSYSPFAKLSQSALTADLLIESSDLDFFLDRNARIAALRDRFCDRPSLVSLLLTLHFASAHARRVGAIG